MKTINQYLSIIDVIRKGGYALMTICIIGEIVFFCSLPNICACVMCFISWWTFSEFFLKQSVILKHPFAWLFYISMVLYRFLPLIATFFEWKPVTYGFENPYYTIFGEIFLFLIQSLAFYIVCYGKQDVFVPLHNLVCKIGFFSSFSCRTIWCMGGVGLFAMYVGMKSGGAEFGDVTGKLLAPMSAMRFIPLVMFFPAIYKTKDPAPSKKILFAYLLLLELLSLMGNSREALVHPVGSFVLLGFLNVIKKNTNFRNVFYSWKILVGLLALVVCLKLFTAISDSMIANRNMRSEMSAVELMKNQVSSIDFSESLERTSALSSYAEGWDETYVDNFLLNRYCNMRITDQTLYYAMQLDGWDTIGNNKMRNAFYDRVLATLPTPVLNFFSIHIDKSNLQYSEGDYLYAEATQSPLFVGYRVASHLALGLATFGLFYFPIQFFLLLLSFYLLDTIVLRKKGFIIYSIAGLAIVFELFGRFRNANGCVGDVAYIFRGYWQFLFIYWLTFYLAKTFSDFLKK